MIMCRYVMLTVSLLLTHLNVIFTEAASTYSYSQANNQDYPLSVYPIQQPQASSTQPNLLQRGSNDFGLTNNYPYQPLDSAAFSGYTRNQLRNYAFVQPTATRTGAGTSYAQSQLALPREQLQQQQRSPFWMGRPIVADYSSAVQSIPPTQTNNIYSNGVYQSSRNTEYAQEPFRTSFNDIRITQRNRERFTPYIAENYYRQRQVQGTPSSQELALLSAQNSLVPFQSNRFATSTDYGKHFERYLRKYPERLQPAFNGSGFRK